MSKTDCNFFFTKCRFDVHTVKINKNKIGNTARVGNTDTEGDVRGSDRIYQNFQFLRRRGWVNSSIGGGGGYTRHPDRFIGGDRDYRPLIVRVIRAFRSIRTLAPHHDVTKVGSIQSYLCLTWGEQRGEGYGKDQSLRQTCKKSRLIRWQEQTCKTDCL